MITIGIDPHKATHTAVAIRAGQRRGPGRSDGSGAHAGLRAAARVEPRARHRRRVGDRGLPPRLRAAWSGFLRERGERRRSRPAEADGADSGNRLGQFGKSDRDRRARRSRARRSAHTDLPDATEDSRPRAASSACCTEHRDAPGRRAARAARIACAGTCTTSGPTLQIPTLRGLGRREAASAASARQLRSRPGRRPAFRSCRELDQAQIRRAHRGRQRAASARLAARVVKDLRHRSCSNCAGCGAITAARIIAEVGAIDRFASERAARSTRRRQRPWTRPPGDQQRHRLNRTRQPRASTPPCTRSPSSKVRVDARAKAFLRTQAGRRQDATARRCARSSATSRGGSSRSCARRFAPVDAAADDQDAKRQLPSPSQRDLRSCRARAMVPADARRRRAKIRRVWLLLDSPSAPLLAAWSADRSSMR